jgi:hypothetical protein
MKQKMHRTDVAHRHTSFSTALLVLPVASIPPLPGVRPLHAPALLQGRAASQALWPRLHLDAPTAPRLGPPGVQGMGGRLRLRPERSKTGNSSGCDVAAQERGGHPRIEPRPGHEESPPPTHRLAPPMPLAPVALLAPILPARGAPDLDGLDRLALAARGTRGRLAPRGPAGPCPPGRHALGPGPGVAPRRPGGRDRALGQYSRREQVPWTPASVQRKKRGEAVPHVDRTRVPAAWARLGRREPWCHAGPWFVREIRGLLLTPWVLLQPKSALLC